jgi:hypothetical protein
VHEFNRFARSNIPAWECRQAAPAAGIVAGRWSVPSEVLIIDSQVADPAAFIAAAGPEVLVYRLLAGTDLLTQSMQAAMIW